MDGVIGRSPRSSKQASEHWISMSDLMAGLMMVFLLISVAFMRYVQLEKDKIKEVAIAYQNTQVAIYDALVTEFATDLPRWDAEIDKTSLELRFKSPEVLFGNGEVELKPAFEAMLEDFFPRYMKTLTPFRDQVTEVRIEGHTSSSWGDVQDPTFAYFNNMALSQGRTREVLEYLYTMPSVRSEQQWMKKTLAAVGFSSAHPIQDEDGIEDEERSRRVAFKVVTNAELQIRKIIQE